MPSETLATYNTQPSSADYIVQGINSYFARQREDQLKAQEESSKLAGLFANNKMLRRAKSGETADFNIGKIPWIVDDKADDKPVYGYANVNGMMIPLTSYDDVQKYSDSQREGGKKLWDAKMATLKGQLSMTNLSADDQSTIQDYFSRKWNGETVDARGSSPTVQSFVKSYEVSPPADDKKKNVFSSISEKTGKAISESSLKLIDRFKGNNKARAAGGLVRDAAKMTWKGAGSAARGVVGMTAPAIAMSTFNPNSGLRQFFSGLSGEPQASPPPSPWNRPMNIDIPEWENVR
jgi:hypothetical protein